MFAGAGLLLAPLFVLGAPDFVARSSPAAGSSPGTIVPLTYLGWSLWLLGLGVGLLVTAGATRNLNQTGEASTCQEGRDPGGDEFSGTSPLA